MIWKPIEHKRRYWLQCIWKSLWNNCLHDVVGFWLYATFKQGKTPHNMKSFFFFKWRVFSSRMLPDALKPANRCRRMWTANGHPLTELGLVPVRHLDKSTVLLIVEDLHALSITVHPFIIMIGRRQEGAREESAKAEQRGEDWTMKDNISPSETEFKNES